MRPRARQLTAFLVEGYAPDSSSNALQDLVQRLEGAADATPTGARVRHVQSSLVPTDEMCLCVLKGPDAQAVKNVAEQAGVRVIRVSPAVHVFGSGG